MENNNEKWLLVKNMMGGLEVIKEDQEYRFGFWSEILGKFDSMEEAQMAAPDD